MNKQKWLVLLLAFMLLLAACQTETTATEAPANDTEAAEGNETPAAQNNDTPPPTLGNIDAVNNYLNTSADLGEGSIANPVAVIPIAHIDGPKNESDFYAFVNFKYVGRDFIKYQISYVSCTCRGVDVNYWQNAYVELTLPESGNPDDSVIRYVSFEKDPSDHYTVGSWGDSDPLPNGATYEQFKTEYLPYFVGKTVGEVRGFPVKDDIDEKSYQEGDGRGGYKLDTWSGASVSTNNFNRMLIALGDFHATDSFFGGQAAQAPAAAPAETTETADATATETAPAEAPAASAPAAVALPAPIDTEKTYKANQDDAEDTACAAGAYASDCSSVNPDNLIDYMNRDDVLYIDLRDFEDYVKKHFRNFEVVPFFAYIFNAEAHTNADLIQLYGGSPTEPVPVYEESDKMLEYLFPKDKTLFIMCQSGGRVKMLLEILEARGWEMDKIYNIGGMAQYNSGAYRDHMTDTPELTITGTYGFEGLTRIAP
ncbi:MAG: rhodanese-like domain-containing protein [Peptoniphilaceae bacterium]|jgi:rhodanese-related sulfurtransferase|nr:rhodanese-like domain-containing protein [Bacillota bacterium]